MTEEKDKSVRRLEIVLGVALLLYVLCRWVLFPYIAVIKAENGEFKETCAYVVDTKKMKNGYQLVIRIGTRYYDEHDILPAQGMSAFKTETWNNFPIRDKHRAFAIVEPTICKKVKYVEVYNIFGFQKFYLYDYLNQP